ncbi:hypothetical protein KGR20_14685 [Cytobacillus oceanisediminis]|nr:hypothetical protein [Niallia sp. RD1]MBZ9535484.1 hypothetical protein [Cytobacillus oceanisediminis]UTI43973.1 hypothetical protein NKG37_10230 [Niallia sp. RD1]
MEKSTVKRKLLVTATNFTKIAKRITGENENKDKNENIGIKMEKFHKIIP